MNLRPVIVSRRSKGTRRPELTLSPGPAHLAQPGAGSYPELYGCPWALALHRDGPQLYQLAAGEWAPREDPGGALVGLVRGVRWTGLAWDQAARPVVAWELDGAVYVRQWDPLGSVYVTRGPWLGCDPVLICDAVTTYQTSDSDVLLLHLDADRATLVGRVQREVFGVAHALAAVPVGSVLDQAVAHPYRWQVLGQGPDGAQLVREPLLYPAELADRVAVLTAVAAGAVIVTTYANEAAHGVAVSTRTSGGELLASLYPVAAAHAVTVGTRASGGELVVSLYAATAAHAVTVGTVAASGVYVQTTSAQTAAHAVTTNTRISGGSYG